MRLIYGIERYFNISQQRHVLLFGERLGRYVQYFGFPVQQIRPHFVNLHAAERRVEEVGYGSRARLEPAKQVHLVLHQGDEGRDDDSRPIHKDGRKLVAEGLSSASGHKHEGVASVKEVAYHTLLVSFEHVVAKEFLERLVDGGGICCHRVFSLRCEWRGRNGAWARTMSSWAA